MANDKLKLDPGKNNFPVTLHDPCNVVRLMGIVEPQRRPDKIFLFREMEPHGVENYCCGGGSGFAIMGVYEFQGLEGEYLQQDEAEADPRCVSGCHGPRYPKICVCPLFKL